MSLLEQDSGAALVQTPQSYMNADPVLRNLQLERWLLPDEEAFYRWVEPVRQGVGRWSAPAPPLWCAAAP